MKFLKYNYTSSHYFFLKNSHYYFKEGFKVTNSTSFVKENDKYYPIQEFQILEEINESNNQIQQNLKEIKFKIKKTKKKKKILELNLTGKISKAENINLPLNFAITNPEKIICTRKTSNFKGKTLIKIEMGIKINKI